MHPVQDTSAALRREFYVRGNVKDFSVFDADSVIEETLSSQGSEVFEDNITSQFIQPHVKLLIF